VDKTHQIYYQSEIGTLQIEGTEKGISGVHFVEQAMVASQDAPAILHKAASQLAAYFGGERQAFSLNLDLWGTPFQQQVWQELLKIPFGETIAYKELAQRVGRRNAFRAVGAANGRNPVSIMVPCHRVVGSDGKLTGYGGGLWRKAWLLDHEQRVLRGEAGG